jgi:hypothetical protein
MKKIAILLFVTFITFSGSAQIQDSTNITKTLKPLRKSSSIAVALGVSGSTNGLGGNIVTSWNDKLALRLSYEAFDKSFPNAFTFDQDDFTFNVSPGIKTEGFSAIIDWYFIKSMYLSAGVMVSNLNLSAKIMSANPLTIGDLEYSPNEIGEMVLAVKPQNKVAPYFGLGFGRNISRDHRFAMSFELGAYHSGSFVVDASGTELFEANGDPANQESIKNLNETLNGISWIGIYPVVKLGVSYRFYKK